MRVLLGMIQVKQRDCRGQQNAKKDKLEKSLWP
jgi:hypothetical protein